jgi:DNA-3-methyladenine glycosylase
VKRAELEGEPQDVAVALLGCRLTANGVTVRLVEVEAYGGSSDPASHAYRGETTRNRTMFGPAGHLYVYVSHGIHACCNVVCGPAGVATAVLLRGGVVVRGHAGAAARRGRPIPGGHLDGPGKLCQALGITVAADDGTDLLSRRSAVRLTSGARAAAEQVVHGPRIGLTKEVERPWRFRLVQPGDRVGPKERPR